MKIPHLLLLTVFPLGSITQDTGSVVGTVEMMLEGETRVFDVVEGPPGEGFSTGYRESIRGESMVLGASLHAVDPESGEALIIQIPVNPASGKHLCDPMANNVEFSPADERATRKRLRPDANPSETCPPDPEGAGGVAIHLNLVEASYDGEAGTLRLKGTFGGPLGRGEEAMHVSEGRFQATIHSFSDLMD